MKYLILAKPGGTPVPPDKLLETYKASQEYGNRLKEDGVFDCYYVFYEGGGMSIANAESHEEVYKFLLGYPMYASFVWEVKPLIDWNKAFETILENF